EGRSRRATSCAAARFDSAACGCCALRERISVFRSQPQQRGSYNARMPAPLRPALPIDAILPEVLASLAAHPRLVLEAPPGAGKTTRVPPALLDAPWLAGRKALMLEPRRIATRAAAAFMAAERGEAPGATVGYRIRHESK